MFNCRNVILVLVQYCISIQLSIVFKYVFSLLCVHTPPVGFTSNGEYNSMRNRGYTRPLSIFQIRSDVRAKYSRLSKKTMLDMLSPERKTCYILPNPLVLIEYILACRMFLFSQSPILG